MATLNDSDFKSFAKKATKVISNGISLSVEGLFMKPIPDFITDPIAFTQKFQAEFPDSTLLKSFNISSFSPRPDFDPNNRYYSGNVCYVRTEDKTSSGKGYDVQKNNTYSLCPLCDPFAKTGLNVSTHKYKCVQGEKVRTDEREPIFYDTLHSQYSHHMGQSHGVFKDNSVAATPFLGFTKQRLCPTSKGEYEFACICPYANVDKQGNTTPCLEVVKANANTKDGNCFKAYFRHIDSCHKHGNISKDSKVKHSNYLPGTNEVNPFIPLDFELFISSLLFLQINCNDFSIFPINLCQDSRVAQFLKVSVTELTNMSTISIKNPQTTPATLQNDFQISPQPLEKTFEQCLEMIDFDMIQDSELFNQDSFNQSQEESRTLTNAQSNLDLELDELAVPELIYDESEENGVEETEPGNFELGDFNLQWTETDVNMDADDYIHSIFNNSSEEEIFQCLGESLEHFNSSF